jgi:biopolymer transport protein ExbD
MRSFKSRVDDSTFELNLAPMLDIIVSIIPMLLMSVVFVQIMVVETPIPQAVEKAITAQEEKNEVQIALAVSKTTGFRISIVDNGRTKETNIALKGAVLDLESLKKEVLQVKMQYPNVFRVELNPDETVALSEIVSVMDQIRTKGKSDPKIMFNDVATGKQIETDLIFPDVVFGNVAGG